MHWHDAIVSILLSGVALSAQAQIAIELKSSVRLDRSEYRLGDVAVIRNASTAELQQLENVVVVHAAQPLPARTVARARLAARVSYLRPDLARTGIAWGGAEKITIETSAHPIEASRITALASAVLHERLARPGARLEAMPIAGNVPSALVFDSDRMTARLTPGAVVSPRICVWVDIERDGKRVTTVPVWFGAKLYDQVLVSRRTLARGAALHASDFVVEERDIASLRAVLPLSAPVETMRTVRGIDQGEVLTRNAVGNIPAVQRDQAVAVSLVRGRVEVETRGIAQADADIGETVRVVNADARAYLATVTGSGRVAIAQEVNP